MPKRKWMLIWTVVGTLLAAAARPEPITFGFSGAIDFVSDPLGSFGGAVAVGTPFAGRFTFDSEAPDRDARQGVGFYLFGVEPFTMEVDVGSLRLRTNPEAPALAIDIADGFLIQGDPADRFLVVSDEFGPVRIAIELLDLDASSLVGDGLLLTPPPLEAFEFRLFEVLDLRDGATLQGDLTELVRLPEPGASAPLALAALWIGARRFRVGPLASQRERNRASPDTARRAGLRDAPPPAQR